MIREELDKQIIRRVIELDKDDKPVSFSDTITGIILKGKIFVDLNKSLLFQIVVENNLNEEILHGSGFNIIRKQLMQAVNLVDYLEKNGYLLLISGNDSKIIGNEFDTEKILFASNSMLFSELEKNLKLVSSKYIIPLKSLIEYANNDFRSIERVAIDEQLNSFKATSAQQEKSINWSRWAVIIATAAVILSAVPIIGSFFRTETLKLIDTEITVKIVNDSLRISSMQDTIKVYSLPLKEIIKPPPK